MIQIAYTCGGANDFRLQILYGIFHWVLGPYSEIGVYLKRRFFKETNWFLANTDHLVHPKLKAFCTFENISYWLQYILEAKHGF